MNIRGSLLTNGGTYWYLKRKPNLDKPELNIQSGYGINHVQT